MLESLLTLDESLYMWVNGTLSNGLFDFILVPLRHKLFWIPLYLILIYHIIKNFQGCGWLVFVGIACTIGLSDFMSSKVVKKNVERMRPCHVEYLEPVIRVPCSNGFSFTSSHATNHFALGSFFFCLFATAKWRWLFFLWAGIISFAQVYVGVHYPSDVICGAILGLAIGLSCFKLYKSLSAHFYRDQNQIA